MPQASGKKILLIGWDAADWEMIDPLLQAGQMPALAQLIKGGLRGNLATLQPVLSPMMWTSIATGKRAEAALGRAYITCNKNGIPFDPEKPFVTSGVRLGTPAGTTRGFKEAEFRQIGNLIVEVLDGLREANSDEGNTAVEAAVRSKVTALTDQFPMYPYL